MFVTTEMYEMGANGLVKVDGRNKSDLELGRVVHFTGGYGLTNKDFVIVENKGRTEKREHWGSRYVLVDMADYHFRQIDAYELTFESEGKKGIRMLITDRSVTPEEVADYKDKAAEKKAKDDADREVAEQEQKARIAQGREIAARCIPKDAKALIVAEYEIDDCDSMSDYYATKTGERVVLGYSTHKRDIFSEMRKFADRIPETAHLAVAPDVDSNGHPKTAENASWWHPADEHREKYSMGAGYYLKAVNRYRTGWKIEKRVKYDDDWDDRWYESLALRCVLPEINQTGQASTKVDGVTVTMNDEKSGVETRFPSKPDQAILDSLKAQGWRWSRFNGCWYNRQTEDNISFANSLQDAA